VVTAPAPKAVRPPVSAAAKAISSAEDNAWVREQLRIARADIGTCRPGTRLSPEDSDLGHYDPGFAGTDESGVSIAFNCHAGSSGVTCALFLQSPSLIESPFGERVGIAVVRCRHPKDAASRRLQDGVTVSIFPCGWSRPRFCTTTGISMATRCTTSTSPRPTTSS
jgi:hypothetical protein